MAKAKTPTDVQEVALKWMQIARAVAWGRLTPEEGVRQLEALAEVYPADRVWLEDEIGTIRRQFGLDVAESIRGGKHSYWDKLGSVMQALLDERLHHERALELLEQIDGDYPEHNEQTAKLIEGIAASPLRRYLAPDD
jgi:hypothetical protein